MKISRRLNATILMAYALPGCATMSSEEYLQANWEEVGYNDAVEGYPVSCSSEHREACVSTAVTVDFALYRNGHALGLPYYCTRETDFETADHGGDSATHCRRETFPDYLVGRSKRLDVSALKTEMREIEIQIAEKSDQAEALLMQVGQLRSARDTPELSKDTRREARYQVTQLESLYRTLNRDIEGLNRARDDVFVEIDALTAAFYRSL